MIVVARERYSTVLIPHRINSAKGWRMERARMHWNYRHNLDVPLPPSKSHRIDDYLQGHWFNAYQERHVAIDAVELQRLNQQYRDLTGQTVRNFVCPITLQDLPGEELCNGHILNQSLVKASRARVIQYKEVDNSFGKSIEP